MVHGEGSGPGTAIPMDETEACASGAEERGRMRNGPAGVGEEDDSEPEEPEPKFLWAAQHNNVELIKDLYSQNSNLVKFADSDGYTALHRAAYSGSKVFLTYMFNFPTP